jgi:DNA-binding MarR family transcriptional regulator
MHADPISDERLHFITLGLGFDFPGSTVRARRAELEDMGLVRKTTDRVDTRSGRTAATYVCTGKGNKLARQMQRNA